MGIDLEIRKYLLERYPRICSQEPIPRRVGEQWVEIEVCAPAFPFVIKVASGRADTSALASGPKLQLHVHG